jgi:hypothetical protein
MTQVGTKGVVTLETRLFFLHTLSALGTFTPAAELFVDCGKACGRELPHAWVEHLSISGLTPPVWFFAPEGAVVIATDKAQGGVLAHGLFRHGLARTSELLEVLGSFFVGTWRTLGCVDDHIKYPKYPYLEAVR